MNKRKPLTLVFLNMQLELSLQLTRLRFNKTASLKTEEGVSEMRPLRKSSLSNGVQEDNEWERKSVCGRMTTMKNLMIIRV